MPIFLHHKFKVIFITKPKTASTNAVKLEEFVASHTIQPNAARMALIIA